MLVLLPGKDKASEKQRKRIVRETALPIWLLCVLRKKSAFKDTRPHVPEAEALLYGGLAGKCSGTFVYSPTETVWPRHMHRLTSEVVRVLLQNPAIERVSWYR